MKWEKLHDSPAIHWNSKHALWLVDTGGQMQMVQLPHASVGDVLALLRSIASLPQEPEKKRK
jgi:hypothetical protein